MAHKLRSQPNGIEITSLVGTRYGFRAWVSNRYSSSIDLTLAIDYACDGRADAGSRCQCESARTTVKGNSAAEMSCAAVIPPKPVADLGLLVDLR